MIEQQPPVTQIFEQQSETNVVMNGIPTVETIGTVNQNNSNQQPIQPEMSVNETATTLISDTQPTLNGNDINNIIPNMPDELKTELCQFVNKYNKVLSAKEHIKLYVPLDYAHLEQKPELLRHNWK